MSIWAGNNRGVRRLACCLLLIQANLIYSQTTGSTISDLGAAATAAGQALSDAFDSATNDAQLVQDINAASDNALPLLQNAINSQQGQDAIAAIRQKATDTFGENMINLAQQAKDATMCSWQASSSSGKEPNPDLEHLAFIKRTLGQDLTEWVVMCISVGGEGSLSGALREEEEIAHLFVFPNLPVGFDISIKGKFPQVRYFAIETYDLNQNGTFVSALRDRDIVAANGLNPFKTKVNAGKLAGTYDIHVTLSGKMGFMNEIASKSPDSVSSDSSWVAVVFKMVAPINNLVQGTGDREWGWVEPPKIQLRPFVGAPIVTMSQCPSTNTDVLNSIQSIARVIVLSSNPQNIPCIQSGMNDNFVLLDPELQGLTYFGSPDYNILISCGNQIAEGGGELLAVITGTLPKVPSQLYCTSNTGLLAQSSAACIPDVTNYQVRYASYSTADLLEPSPILNTITDQEIEEFYSDVNAWDRTFRIVATSSTAVAQRCKSLDSTTMFMSTASKDTITPVVYPGLVYREISNYDINYHNSIYDVRRTCQATHTCNLPKTAATVMGKYYPRVSYYVCSKDGFMTKVDTISRATPPPTVRATTKGAVIGPAAAAVGGTALETGPEDVNSYCSGTVEVTITANNGYEVYADKRLIGTSNDSAVAWHSLTWGVEEAPSKLVVGVKLPFGLQNRATVRVDVCHLPNVVSDYRWKCTSTPPTGPWTSPEFDDSEWLPPRLGLLEECKGDQALCGRLADALSIQPEVRWPETCPMPDGSEVTLPSFNTPSYCRLVVESTCGENCPASLGQSLSPYAACTKNNAVAAIISKVTATGRYEYYVRGSRLGGDTVVTASKPKVFLTNTRWPERNIILGMKVTKQVGADTMIVGDFVVCGGQLVTDEQWKCTNDFQDDDSWLLSTYDDSVWKTARVYSTNANTNALYARGVDETAQWIWAGPAPTDPLRPSILFCRLKMPNPLYALANT